MKKFEREGPKIIITLRELTIRIVKAVCKFSQWRNANYIKHILQRDQNIVEDDNPNIELPQELHGDA